MFRVLKSPTENFIKDVRKELDKAPSAGSGVATSLPEVTKVVDADAAASTSPTAATPAASVGSASASSSSAAAATTGRSSAADAKKAKDLE